MVKFKDIKSVYIGISVCVKFEFYGLHHWPNADSVKGVEYLKNPHRHKFFAKVKLPVDHSDRDVEFIDLKNKLLELTKKWPFDLKTSSVEDLAIAISVATMMFLNEKTENEIYLTFPWIYKPWERPRDKEEILFPEDIDLCSIEVEVSEDNENSAHVEIFPTHEDIVDFSPDEEEDSDEDDSFAAY